MPSKILCFANSLGIFLGKRKQSSVACQFIQIPYTAGEKACLLYTSLSDNDRRNYRYQCYHLLLNRIPYPMVIFCLLYTSVRLRLPIPDWKRSYFSVPASAQVLTPLMVIRVVIMLLFRWLKMYLSLIHISEYHERIIDLVNKNANLIRERMKAA